MEPCKTGLYKYNDEDADADDYYNDDDNDDGWMDERVQCNFRLGKGNRQAGITVMRRMALVTRTKIMSNMAAPRLNLGLADRSPA